MASQLQFVPLLVGIMFPASFIVTYTIAVSYEHIRPFFSYISDTGTTSPESCWFSLFLSLTGVGLGFLVYIRYKQVDQFISSKNEARNWVNNAGFIMGMVSALGATVVGAFQETNVFGLHVVGAFMAFLGGSIYFCFQAYFTFKMLPIFTNRYIAIARTVIGVGCIFLFALTYTCGVFAVKKFTGENIVYWKPEDGGWNLRIISVTSEWIMASLFDLYVLSFMLDFRHVYLTEPKVLPYEQRV